MTTSSKITHSSSAQRAAHIRTLLSANDPFFSLAQAARRANIPLSSLSQAVTNGKIAALVMPDGRRYVAWSEIEKFMTHARNHHAAKAYILLRLADLSSQGEIGDLPSDFAANHDKYIHDLTQ